jgi:hypothetical protein
VACSVEAELAQDAHVVVDARPHREHQRPEEDHAAGVEVDHEAGARNRVRVVEEEPSRANIWRIVSDCRVSG